MKAKNLINSKWLQGNLDIIKNEAIPNKWDALIVLFGGEGVGKSTLGTQICKYLDNNFGIDNIVYTPKQFETACEELSEESAILWDEAITGANVQQHASTISQSIISKLTMIRKKRMKFVLCFPYLYMLNKYFISRSLASMYVYAKDFKRRGYAYFYSRAKTQYMYNLMKERFKYNPEGVIRMSKKNFRFRFNKTFCVDEQLYDEKKENSRNTEAETKDIWKQRLADSLRYLRDETNITIKQVADNIGVKYENLYAICRT